MRFSSVKIRGLGPLKNVDIDLSKIDGPLVAVCGPNGVGKSVFLELLTGGASYRNCKTRGPLAGLATTRDAFVESVITNAGRTWTVRQMVDAVNGKGESLVLDEDGKPALDTTKVRDYDEWAKLNLVPPEVLYSSSVAVQQSSPRLGEKDRGFMSLTRGNRMAVLLRTIGMERLEKLSDLARKRATVWVAKADGHRALLKDAESRAKDPEYIDRMVRQAAGVLVEQTVETAYDVEAHRRAVLAQEDVALADEIRGRRRAAVSRVGAITEDLRDNAERLTNNRGVLENGAAILAACARADILTGQLDQIRAEAAGLGTVAAVDRAAWAQAEAALTVELGRQRQDVEARDRATAALLDEAIVAAAVGGLEAERARVDDAVDQVDTRETVIYVLQDELLTHKDVRIGDLRASLWTIAAQGPQVPDHEYALEAVTLDDARRDKAAELPAAIEREQKVLAAAKTEVGVCQSRARELERVAARQPEMDLAGAALRKWSAAITASQITVGAAVAASAELKTAADDALAAAENKRKQEGEVHDERQGLEAMVRRRKALDEAGARVDELELQCIALESRKAEAVAELAELPDLPADGEAVDLGALKSAVDRSKAMESDMLATVARWKAEHQVAVEAAARIEDLKSEVDVALAEVSDWSRLANDLGRDGLQALEVDAAVPTLNKLVNELLHESHGPRFTVDFRTERDVNGGKETREALDVQVIDSVKGRDDLAESYSGGELVIVGEAVALGLTVLGCTCLGIDRPTIFRDETGSALDEENRPAYMRMLRQAAKMIDADKVFFVSHNREMVDMADARIVIDKLGNVEVTA